MKSQRSYCIPKLLLYNTPNSFFFASFVVCFLWEISLKLFPIFPPGSPDWNFFVLERSYEQGPALMHNPVIFLCIESFISYHHIKRNKPRCPVHGWLKVYVILPCLLPY